MRAALPGHLAPITLLLVALACAPAPPEPTVHFVHATDPHLFEEPDHAVQEGHNRRAFERLLADFGTLSDPPPRFLLLTGDLGLGETLAADGEAPEEAGTAGQQASGETGGGETAEGLAPALTERIGRLAAILRTRPGLTVYWVPGNNDVAGEAAGGLAETSALLEAVQAELAGSEVTLVDLTACYVRETAPLAACQADVAGTDTRLVGFPTHSFKPQPDLDEAATKERRELHRRWIERLAALVEAATGEGRRVLLATHIAELDDPYRLAQQRYARPVDATAPADPLAASAWGVEAEIVARWKAIVEDPGVAAVLSGHFHDPHAAIYRPPYAWASFPPERASPDKLLLTPPLAVRLQDSSPIQARGASLVGVGAGGVTRSLLWYDGVEHVFTPEGEPAAAARRPVPAPPEEPAWPVATARWLWALPGDADPMARAAVIAIALLVAFLTVVELWQVPPPARLTEVSNQEGKASAPEGSAPPAGDGETAGVSRALPFRSNLARTVVSGLGGLAVVAFADEYWTDANLDEKAYYLVLFVAFFLAGLLLSALVRGLVEAGRSRIAVEQGPPVWHQSLPPGREDNGQGRGRGEIFARGWRRLRYALAYWFRRLWRWGLSMRPTVMIFFDTAFAVVQGRNQAKTAILGDTILDLQWSVVRTAERVRDQVDEAIYRALRRQLADGGYLHGRGIRDVSPKDFRVNVSVLSSDGASVFYVARSRGSLMRSFEKHSVAWVAVASSEARWWSDKPRSQPPEQRIYAPDQVLFDNRSGKLAVETEELELADFFQFRRGDYGAFMVLPVPWARRGMEGEYRHAGIQISFEAPELMDALWAGLEVEREGKHEPAYALWDQLLEAPSAPLPAEAPPASRSRRRSKGGQGSKAPEHAPEAPPHLRDPELAAVLGMAVEVLAEDLRHFNQTVFESRIRPQLAH